MRVSNKLRVLCTYSRPFFHIPVNTIHHVLTNVVSTYIVPLCLKVTLHGETIHQVRKWRKVLIIETIKVKMCEPCTYREVVVDTQIKLPVEFAFLEF